MMTVFVTLFCTILSDMRAALGAFMGHRSRGHAVVWLGTRAYAPAPPITPRSPWKSSPSPGTASTAPPNASSASTSAGSPTPCPNPARPRPESRARTAPPNPISPPNPPGSQAATDHHVRGYASQLGAPPGQPRRHRNSSPPSRSAGRILRPLCHMLGIDLPAPLALPRKPRKPRARPEKPPEPPIRHGKYTPAQIRRYRPGRIPESIPKPP